MRSLASSVIIIELSQKYITKTNWWEREQLRIIEPDVIVALGSPATKTLLGTNEGISKVRGRFHVYHGIPLMPTFHPAYILRNPGDQYKRDTF